MWKGRAWVTLVVVVFYTCLFVSVSPAECEVPEGRSHAFFTTVFPGLSTVSRTVSLPGDLQKELTQPGWTQAQAMAEGKKEATPVLGLGGQRE